MIPCLERPQAAGHEVDEFLVFGVDDGSDHGFDQDQEKHGQAGNREVVLPKLTPGIVPEGAMLPRRDPLDFAEGERSGLRGGCS